MTFRNCVHFIYFPSSVIFCLFLHQLPKLAYCLIQEKCIVVYCVFIFINYNLKNKQDKILTLILKGSFDSQGDS